MLEATWDEGNNGSVETTYTYTYDDAGNRESKTIVGAETKVTTYQYNSLGQLFASSSGGDNWTYTYDVYGNQVTQSKNGSLELEYAWSISNEMLSATDHRGTQAVTITFGYDEKGARVSRQQDSNDPTRYLTDHRNSTGYSQVLAELDESATQMQGNGYTYGDSLIAHADSSSASFFHGDHLGSTRLLTGTDGISIVDSSFNYSPYGSPLNHLGSSLTSYRYTGQYLETNLGLQYHRARWLKLATGNWLSIDPVFDYPNNFGNPYAYVGGNAVNAMDLSGMFSFSEVTIVAAIQGVIAGAVTCIGTMAWQVFYKGKTVGEAWSKAWRAAAMAAAVTFLATVAGVATLSGLGISVTSAAGLSFGAKVAVALVQAIVTTALYGLENFGKMSDNWMLELAFCGVISFIFAFIGANSLQGLRSQTYTALQSFRNLPNPIEALYNTFKWKELQRGFQLWAQKYNTSQEIMVKGIPAEAAKAAEFAAKEEASQVSRSLLRYTLFNAWDESILSNIASATVDVTKVNRFIAELRIWTK